MLTLDDLRVYQSDLAEELFADHGKLPGKLLAVEMALGKTVTTATAVRWLLDCFLVRKVLIVAPLRVAQKTWPDEFKDWKHLQALHWHSLVGDLGQKMTPAQRLDRLKAFLNDPKAEIAIINRENVVWLYKTLRELKVRWPFDCLVYDESSRLKEAKKRTGNKNLSEFGVYCKVRKEMSYVIELTGTPSPNGLQDLWGQISLIDLGERLGTTKSVFLKRYFESDYMGWKYTPLPWAEEEITKRVSDIMVSLKARDHVELPPVMTTPDLPPIMVDLSAKQMKDYRRFQRDLALEEHDIEAVNKGVLTFKLLQFGQGSVYRTDEMTEETDEVPIHDLKLDALERLVSEINGANLLVAYAYKFDIRRIMKRFPKARLATEPGAIDDWNKGKVQMLLAHPASLGHGMNLQHGGHHMVWYGLTPSLELYQQMSARLPRPGQPADTVFIHHILARGTFDERLVDVLADRDATQDRITEAVKWQLREARTG
jgi:SNF2 family DNA or RNA helicase